MRLSASPTSTPARLPCAARSSAERSWPVSSFSPSAMRSSSGKRAPSSNGVWATSSEPASRGTLVHRALQLLFTYTERGERSRERAGKALDEAFSEFADDEEMVGLDLDIEGRATLYKEATTLLDRYYELMRLGDEYDAVDNFAAAEDAYRDALAVQQRILGSNGGSRSCSRLAIHSSDSRACCMRHRKFRRFLLNLDWKRTASNRRTSAAACAASGRSPGCLICQRPDICSITSLESIRTSTSAAPRMAANIPPTRFRRAA